MTVHWTHITFAVSDVDRSIDFYNSFCNLVVVRDRRRDGGGTVWLGPVTPADEKPKFVMVIAAGEIRYRMDHLGFQCQTREEVDLIAERAKAEGILELPPTESGGVVGYWTMIRDPDGHRVEFTYGQPIEGLG